MKQYKHIGFRKSLKAGKKYDAVLKKIKTGGYVYVPFGASKWEHYKDSTGLALYSHKNHNNKQRRASYIARHKGFIKPKKYSPGYFSMHYLW